MTCPRYDTNMVALLPSYEEAFLPADPLPNSPLAPPPPCAAPSALPARTCGPAAAPLPRAPRLGLGGALRVRGDVIRDDREKLRKKNQPTNTHTHTQKPKPRARWRWGAGEETRKSCFCFLRETLPFPPNAWKW